MLKIFLVSLFLFPLFSASSVESDNDKYSTLKILVELSEDAASGCKLHIKVYSDMVSDECNRVFQLREKMSPYFEWYSKMLADKKTAVKFINNGHPLISFDQLSDDIGYIGEFKKLKYP